MLSRWTVRESDMKRRALQLSASLTPGMVIFLIGELGAGKTTLVRECLRALGYQGIVKSPTYTLVEEYDIEGLSIYHFDLYRVGEAFELEFIGIQEYFRDTSICFVEWPEKGLGYLPSPDLEIMFNMLENARQITIKAMTDKGQEALTKCAQLSGEVVK